MSKTYLHTVECQKVTDSFRSFFGYDTHIAMTGIPPKTVVFHDIYPLGFEAGHVLLWGKEGNASIAVVSKEQQQQLETAKDIILKRLHALYPKHTVLFFEHGPGVINGCQVDCGGCHIDQIHIHFVVLLQKIKIRSILPILESLLTQNGWLHPEHIRENVIAWKDIGMYTKHFPYLHVGWDSLEDKSHMFVYPQTDESYVIESQLMRKVVGILHGHPEPGYWHWRDMVQGFASQARMAQLQKEVPIFRKKFEG